MGRSAPSRLMEQMVDEIPQFFLRRQGWIGDALHQVFVSGGDRPFPDRQIQLLLVTEVVVHGCDIGVSAAADFP